MQANEADDARLANLLGALAVALTDATARAVEIAAGHGETDAAALATVAAYPGEPVDVLARTLALSPAGATRALDRLGTAGLVERRAGTGDARSRTVVPTPAGRRAARRLLDARRAALGRALVALSPADRAELARLLDLMLAAVTPDRPTCDHTCRLCDVAACPQDVCPVELAALRAEGPA